MDPITAIQCALAVLSFFDFGLKLVSEGKEIYKSAEGVSIDHAEQDAVAKRLSALSDRLVLRIEETKKLKNLTPAESTLQQIMIESNDAAQEFTSAIDELRVTGKHLRWNSFRQALKSLWKKDEIERKRVKLESLRQEILTHMLVIIHETQGDISTGLQVHIDNASKATITIIKNHSSELKALLGDLSHDLHTATKRSERQLTTLFQNQNVALDDIRHIGQRWMSQHSDQLGKIIQQLQNDRSQRADAKLRTTLLRSLAYEQMSDRLDNISIKAQQTFEWAISHCSDKEDKWTDLNTWLRSQGGVYWIAGKAGSGKSTMMKWLVEDPKVRDLLDIWASKKELIVLKCFFWSSGAALQSSSAGFFRAMLHDLVLRYPTTMAAISPARTRSVELELDYFPPWSVHELTSTTNAVLQALSTSSAICLFVDGLDECNEQNGHRQRVLDFINRSTAALPLKVVTSSRLLPDIEFDLGGLKRGPDLRLQDLTASDIKTFVESKLTSDQRFATLLSVDSDFAEKLAVQVTDRAEGVFLWVRIVVESLLRGLRNQDTASDLTRRLHETSPELTNIFEKLLSAIEPVYRVRVLKLLKLVLEQDEPPSLMTCSFLDNYQPCFSMRSPVNIISPEAMQQRLTVARLHIKVQCLGLLEVREERVDPSCKDLDDATSTTCYGESVEFLHSTAREYLTQHGSLFIQAQEMADFNTDMFLMEALLAQMKMGKTICLRLLFHILSVVERQPRPLCRDILRLLKELSKTVASQELPTEQVHQTMCRLYSIDDHDPLLSLAILYDIAEYVVMVIAAEPDVVTRARHVPLLKCALRRLPQEGNWTLSPQPNPHLIALLLSRGADPNGYAINPPEETSASSARSNIQPARSFFDYSIWDDYMNHLNRNAAEIRAQEDQAAHMWYQSAKLMLEYGAGHRTSIFPKDWLSLKNQPPESLVVAFG